MVVWTAEILSRAYAAVSARDLKALEPLVTPDVVLQTTVETLHGLNGLARWLDEVGQAFDDYVAEPGEPEEVGGHLVVPVHQRARGKTSGVEVDHVFTHVLTLRDGRVAELRAFTDREDALRYAEGTGD